MKMFHCPKQIGLGGTISFPLPKTYIYIYIYILNNNNNFLKKEEVKSTNESKIYDCH